MSTDTPKGKQPLGTIDRRVRVVDVQVGKTNCVKTLSIGVQLTSEWLFRRTVSFKLENIL